MPDVSDNALLSAKNVSIKFGGLTAVSGFNLELKKNELVGLIGPNGAGKTTVFNMLTGVYQPTDGEINLSRLPPKVLSLFNFQNVESGEPSKTFGSLKSFPL